MIYICIYNIIRNVSRICINDDDNNDDYFYIKVSISPSLHPMTSPLNRSPAVLPSPAGMYEYIYT